MGNRLDRHIGMFYYCQQLTKVFFVRYDSCMFSSSFLLYYTYAATIQPMPGQMEELALYKKGTGLIKKEKLHDEKEVKPQNDLTTEEKLDMALTMSESMAELHGFAGGVM